MTSECNESLKSSQSFLSQHTQLENVQILDELQIYVTILCTLRCILCIGEAMAEGCEDPSVSCQCQPRKKAGCFTGLLIRNFPANAVKNHSNKNWFAQEADASEQRRRETLGQVACKGAFDMTAVATAVPSTMPSIPSPACVQSAGNVNSGSVRVSTPQIHWHGKSPIFALDFHPRNRKGTSSCI
jgi:hypothetical protein